MMTIFITLVAKAKLMPQATPPDAAWMLDGAPPIRCSGCGAEHWVNAKPCAAALVIDAQDRVLLTRRAADPWRALWCAPSGFCDGPEHPILAAEREVREEVGLEARVVAYLGTWIDPYADPGDLADEYVSVQYYVAVPAGATEPEVDLAEVTEARWFPLAETPADLAPPETLAAVLRALREARRGGAALRTLLADRPTG